jgi:hypothetical protein
MELLMRLKSQPVLLLPLALAGAFGVFQFESDGSLHYTSDSRAANATDPLGRFGPWGRPFSLSGLGTCDDHFY